MKKLNFKNNIFKITVRLLFIVLLLCSFTQEAKAIRIGLHEGVKKTYVGSSENAEFSDANTGKLLFISRSFTPYSIKAYGQSIAIKVKGRYYDCSTNAIYMHNPENKGFLATKKRWYRGDMFIYNFHSSQPSKKTITAEKGVFVGA